MTAAMTRHLALALSLLFIGTGTAAATFRPAVFSPAKSFPVGQTPVSVAMGEFNQDGRADLVVANSGSRTITLLNGDGEGSFNSSQEIYAGQMPAALVVTDVNADGRHDIVVALKGENSVVILLGNGDGSFRPPIAHATGIAPSALAVADLNADRVPDLFVADQDSNTITILSGIGDGSFVLSQTLATEVTPVAIVVADFNRDGRRDVAVASAVRGSITVHLGLEDGTFRPPIVSAAGMGACTLLPLDVNNDGILDMIVANRDTGTASVLLGGGNGAFYNRTEYPTGPGPTAIAAADLNGDLRIDLAVANTGSSTLSILHGNGNGTFGKALSFGAEPAPAGLLVYDFDRDGKKELAVTNSSMDLLALYLNETVMEPELVISPDVHDFGELLAEKGTQPLVQPFTIGNEGNATLQVSAMTFSGPAAPMFSVVPGGGTPCSGLPPSILPNATCTFSVGFLPTTGGNLVADLVISSNDPKIPERIIPLSGSGGQRLANLTLLGFDVGSGKVSFETGEECTANCSQPFSKGSSLELTATPDVDSYFAGWTGCDTASDSSCQLLLDASRTVTALFLPLPPPVSLAGTPARTFPRLQDAYASATDNAVIQIRTTGAPLPFTADRPLTVRVSGGFDPEFTVQTGVSALQGPFVIMRGCVIVDRLVVR